MQKKEALAPNLEPLIFKGLQIQEVEYYTKLPIENLLNDLRFQYFKGSSEKDIKELLKIAMYVPLKDPKILEDVLFTAIDGNIKECKEIMSKNMISREIFIAKMAKQGLHLKKVKNIEEMIDLYFTESDEEKAILFFKTLISFNIYDPEEKAYKAYIQSYKQADERSREMYRRMFMYGFMPS